MTIPSITIPKKISRGEELVVVRRHDFEAFQQWQREVTETLEKVRRGRREYRHRKTVTVA